MPFWRSNQSFESFLAEWPVVTSSGECGSVVCFIGILGMIETAVNWLTCDFVGYGQDNFQIKRKARCYIWCVGTILLWFYTMEALDIQSQNNWKARLEVGVILARLGKTRLELIRLKWESHVVAVKCLLSFLRTYMSNYPLVMLDLKITIQLGDDYVFARRWAIKGL